MLPGQPKHREVPVPPAAPGTSSIPHEPQLTSPMVTGKPSTNRISSKPAHTPTAATTNTAVDHR
jgi:hypothetical protein